MSFSLSCPWNGRPTTRRTLFFAEGTRDKKSVRSGPARTVRANHVARSALDLTRQRYAHAAALREPPLVEVEKEYAFNGRQGTVSLAISSRDDVG
jgi:predicted dithiol-disulfide oxidoreductase (DUF899 family)